MQETNQFAARHAVLTEEFTRLYGLIDSGNNSGSFSADLLELNSRICELQREVLAKVARRS